MPVVQAYGLIYRALAVNNRIEFAAPCEKLLANAES